MCAQDGWFDKNNYVGTYQHEHSSSSPVFVSTIGRLQQQQHQTAAAEDQKRFVLSVVAQSVQGVDFVVMPLRHARSRTPFFLRRCFFCTNKHTGMPQGRKATNRAKRHTTRRATSPRESSTQTLPYGNKKNMPITRLPHHAPGPRS